MSERNVDTAAPFGFAQLLTILEGDVRAIDEKLVNVSNEMDCLANPDSEAARMIVAGMRGQSAAGGAR